MKRIITSLFVFLHGFLALADATIGIENYTANKPICIINSAFPSVDPIPYSSVWKQDAFVQLMGNGVLVKEFIVPQGAGGYFNEGVGVVPGVADNSFVNFTLRCRIEPYGMVGQISWSQVTGSWNPAAIPPTPAIGPALEIPRPWGIVLIPEPSTILLGLLGAAVLFFCRPKHE